MAKVKVRTSFIGQPDEMEKYAGRIPDHVQNQHKMKDADRRLFSHIITSGTEMEVSDKRAHELASLGLIHTDEKVKSEKKANEKVADIQVTDKKKNAGPGK